MTDPATLSTFDLCKRLAELVKDQTGETALSARELAWRVECTLQQDLIGNPDALAFLKAFPE